MFLTQKNIKFVLIGYCHHGLPIGLSKPSEFFTDSTLMSMRKSWLVSDGTISSDSTNALDNNNN